MLHDMLSLPTTKSPITVIVTNTEGEHWIPRWDLGSKKTKKNKRNVYLTPTVIHNYTHTHTHNFGTKIVQC